MPIPISELRYPRRRTIRSLLRFGSSAALSVLTQFTIYGEENIPHQGPLLVVMNHFSYLDPVALLKTIPWPMELIGGVNNPGAPGTVSWIPRIWDTLPVYRGTGSRYALKAAETILKQNGVVGIFPEGGSWAPVLRPPRPGAAYLIARTGAPVLPIGLDGLIDVFPRLKEGKRAAVTVRVGKPFGPFKAKGRGRERRRHLDEIGHEIMHHISDLLPPERRGFYSDDPAIREAARGTEIYPWADKTEFDFSVGEQLKEN